MTTTHSFPLTSRTDSFGEMWASYIEGDSNALGMLCDWVDEHRPHESYALLVTLRAFQQPMPIGRRFVMARYMSNSKRILLSFGTNQTRNGGQWYWFTTIERACQYVEGLLVEQAKKDDTKDSKRSRIAAAKEAWVNPYKVGQLLYNSWGYDQTNYDFAQIVKVGKRSVTIRRINGKHIRSVGWASDIVSPARDSFLSGEGRQSGEPVTLSIQFNEYSKPTVVDGKVEYIPTIQHRIPGWSECGDREEFNATSYH